MFQFLPDKYIWPLNIWGRTDLKMTRGNVWFIITSLDQVSISIVNFGMFYCCLILTIYKCLLLSVSVRSPWTVKYLLMCLSTTHVSKNTKKVQKVHAFHVRVQLKLWICSDGALKAFFFFFFYQLDDGLHMLLCCIWQIDRSFQQFILE